MTDLSIITATYNECDNIGLLIDTIETLFSKNKLKGEIVVVDDSSPDGTANIVKEKKKQFKNVVLVSRPGKLGIGSAYGDGAAKASGDVLVFMDADFSHPPDVIPELYEHAKNGKVAVGSRYVVKGSFYSNFFRMSGTGILNRLIVTFLNTSVSDNTNGFLAIKKANLEKILEYGKAREVNPFDRVLYQVPMIYIALQFDTIVKEIRAPYKFRERGETKINYFEGVKLMAENIMYIPYLILKIGLPKPMQKD